MRLIDQNLIEDAPVLVLPADTASSWGYRVYRSGKGKCDACGKVAPWRMINSDECIRCHLADDPLAYKWGRRIEEAEAYMEQHELNSLSRVEATGAGLGVYRRFKQCYKRHRNSWRTVQLDRCVRCLETLAAKQGR